MLDRTIITKHPTLVYVGKGVTVQDLLDTIDRLESLVSCLKERIAEMERDA